MFKNQIKIAFRNLWRQRGYTLINVAGLAIGIACCILILLYVNDELSYDEFNTKADRIYRVSTYGVIGPNEFLGAVTPAPMAEAFKREIPEVEESVRFRNFGFPVIRYKDKVFSEEHFYSADSTFFDIFTAEFLAGNPQTALSNPNQVVITKSTADKYFAGEDPMGKVLNSDNRNDYIVSGVIRDFPRNSHFHADFIGSMVNRPQAEDKLWVSNNFYTYLLLRENARPEEVESKFAPLIKKYVAPQIQEATGQSWDQLVKAGLKWDWNLQKLTDIHLHSNLEHEIEPNGNATYVYIFVIVALAILVIACINFMNLSTARSASRAREVGLRKTLGSSRGQLIRQFLTESIILTAIALVLALILVEMLMPAYNILTGKHLAVGYRDNWMTIPYLILFTVVVGTLAGSYPAFFMASFKPVKVLKGKLESQGKTGQFLRSGLVVFQFSVSIALIAGTIIVSDQLEYMRNKNLGFNKDQVVIIEKTDDIGRQIEAFKTELLSIADVQSVNNTTHYIGQNFSSNAFRAFNSQETQLCWNMWSDYNFADVYQVDMSAGRFLSKAFKSDSTAVVLNESAARVLGLQDPVGKDIIQVGPTPEQSHTKKVIGVMKDFHFESLHHPIRPFILLPFDRGGFGRYTSVRIKPQNMQATIRQMEQTWQKFAGNQAFEYTFFDQEFARLYTSETRTGKLMAVFSILAIFIACLGLFGLASYSTVQRTREIGVRKVLGASVLSIVLMLFRNTVRLVLIAILIAIPVTFLMMSNWLQNFAYRIELGWFVFLAAALLAFFIALFTVSFQAVKAALTNPATALHYE